MGQTFRPGDRVSLTGGIVLQAPGGRWAVAGVIVDRRQVAVVDLPDGWATATTTVTSCDGDDVVLAGCGTRPIPSYMLTLVERAPAPVREVGDEITLTGCIIALSSRGEGAYLKVQFYGAANPVWLIDPAYVGEEES